MQNRESENLNSLLKFNFLQILLGDKNATYLCFKKILLYNESKLAGAMTAFVQWLTD